MRRPLLACLLTMLTAIGSVLVACSASSSSNAKDASTSTGEDATTGVTCYNLVSAGTVSVASADACRVLESGHSSVTLPGMPPAGIVVSKVCSELCIGVHGDNFCVVAPSFVSDYEAAHSPDGGTEAGASDASTSQCPGNDGGAVTITCYSESPYQLPPESTCP